ncbi:impB/mucB/samB family protein [Thozetella sp. PMI_491]|nr:impB/mucB/samB family protein [Thozetella sp. PMI_491]
MGSRLDKNSSAVRKRIETHTFSDEAGDEYEASEFGGFGDYFRRKKIKLQNFDSELRASAGDKPQIFKGIVAHVSGYTQPPLHILHKELVLHGAGFLQYLDSKTMATHIIASSMPPKKAVDFRNCRIVNPAWVTDSIKAGKLLPWSDYKVVEEGPRQKTLKFDGDKLSSQSTQQSPLGYRSQTDRSFYTSQFQKPSSHSTALNSSIPSGPQPRTSSSEHSDQKSHIPEDMPPTLSLPVPKVLLASSEPSPAAAKHEDHHGEGYEQSILSPPGDPFDQHIEDYGPEESVTKSRAMTSEEHNAILLADPNVRKSTTANPNFLKQYYSESRLHHLSTWKAELKSKMQRMAAEQTPAKNSTKRKPNARRYIMHIDFDSFFCAVSLKKNPEYVDRPAVVAHGNGSGSEIASCNYPARKFGVKNGMWMKRALELCPDLKVLPYDFPAYEEVSRQFYAAIISVGGVVQSVSIDEALVDVTGIVLDAAVSDGVGVNEGDIWREQEEADKIATGLRARIKEQTNCNVSVGIGNNILLAKVALRKAKPAGQYQVKPEEVLDLLGELKAEELPGVAYSISGKLEEISIKYVKDIRDASKERLVSALGPKLGERLWEYSRGIDKAEVGDQPVRKSVSAEVNWGIRFTNQEEAEGFVRDICKELEKRLLNEGVKGKQFQVKIMRRAADAPLDPPKHLGHGKCDTFNKSVSFGVATNDSERMGKEAITILRSYKFGPGDLRGIGVSMMKLEPLKSSTVGSDGSQKKLQFEKPSIFSAKRTITETIDDSSPEKPKRRSQPDDDPIADDPLTPRKPKVHPAIALAKVRQADEKAKTPLNIAGTQFMLPANADPAVLAELPQDIRSKLMAQGRKQTPTASREESPFLTSRSQSPQLGDDIPPDVDPEVFNSLPDDMKVEILASYRQQRSMDAPRQSPRPERIGSKAKKSSTPTKRGIKGMFSRAKERQADSSAGLYQTSFARAKDKEAGPSHATNILDDLDPEFLAELPEDVRKEIIADHKRRSLAQKSGLNFQGRMGRNEMPALAGQAKLQFPTHPPKISFGGTASVNDIKTMLKAWHGETREDGPHGEDVEVFAKYLARVVGEERDMEKAKKLVTWLDWLVEEAGGAGRGPRRWKQALGSIREATQEATQARGLGPMDLGS